MRVLVTGAGGFLGSAVVRALLAARHEVTTLRGPDDGPVPEGQASLRTEVADIQDSAVLNRLAAGADLVVHAAGPPSVRCSFDAPLKYVHDHVAGTASVAEACRRQNVKRLVHISSAEVYGPDAPVPANESSPFCPASPYAAAKIGAEAFTRALAEGGHCSVAVLRPFSVYGPGGSPSSVLGTILGHVAARRAIVLHDLRPVRDYVWIDDLACAVLLAGSATLKEPWRAFNVASGVGSSVGQVVSLVLAACRCDLPVVAHGEEDRPTRTGAQVLRGDTTRATRELAFSTSVPLREGIRLLVNAAGSGRSSATDIDKPCV